MVSLKKILQEHFGENFPVANGSTSQEQPLVITDTRDYVSIEYAVATFLLKEMGFEYKLQVQRTHNYDNRVVDELVYAVREPKDPSQSQTQHFFFDISAGFNRGRSADHPTERQSPQKFGFSLPQDSYETKPSNTGNTLLTILRWVAFLPVALVAAWLVTRFLMFFRLGQLQQNNPYVVIFFMQAVSGATIGWVGVKIAPSAKKFAIVCCSLLSIVISGAYFLRFNDLLGGLAATTGIVATVIAGLLAREDD